MARLLESFISGGQAGRRAYENRHEDERESALGKLAGQSYTAPQEERPSILAKMAQYSPQFAGQQQSAFRADEERNRTRIAGAAKFMLDAYKSADQARIQGAYQAVRPILEEAGKAQGKAPPPSFSDDMLPHIYQLAGENGGSVNSNPYSELPSDIQSLRILSEDPVLAKLDKERRTYSGMVPKPFETSQGIGWGTPGGGIRLAPVEGVAGQSNNPTMPTDTAPVTQTGGQGSFDPANLQNDFRSIAQETGFEITSMQRPVIPGVGAGVNSQHPNGTAADFRTTGKSRPEIDRLIARLRRDPRLEVIDESNGRTGTGPHVHVELKPQYARGGMSGPGPGSPKIAQPFVKPETPNIPAGFERTPDGNLRFTPGGPADPSVIAQRPMDPQKRYKLDQQKRKELASVDAMDAKFDRTLDLINSLLDQSGKFKGVTGMGAWGARIPGSPWADIAAKLDTLKAQSAFGALQEMRANSPTGGALGSTTERELGMLQNAETQLQNTQSPEALEEGLMLYRKNLLESKARIRRGVEEFYEQEAGGAPTGPQQSSNPQIDSLLEKYR